MATVRDRVDDETRQKLEEAERKSREEKAKYDVRKKRAKTKYGHLLPEDN